MSARAEAAPSSVDDIVVQVTGRRPLRRTPLSGGCIAEIFKGDLDGGDDGIDPGRCSWAFALLRYSRNKIGKQLAGQRVVDRHERLALDP